EVARAAAAAADADGGRGRRAEVGAVVGRAGHERDLAGAGRVPRVAPALAPAGGMPARAAVERDLDAAYAPAARVGRGALDGHGGAGGDGRARGRRDDGRRGRRRVGGGRGGG